MRIGIAALFAALLPIAAASAQEPKSISVIGDSFVFRSGWDCAGTGLDPAGCLALKVDSSFASHLAYPYSWTTQPEFNVVGMHGVGGSTCFLRDGDSGLVQRLQGLSGTYTYGGEDKVAVMIGINDVIGYNQTPAQTAACLKDSWAVIANTHNATPVAFTYPPINASVWPGKTTEEALTARAALNMAIRSAVTEFNAAQRALGKKEVEFIVLDNTYNPTTGTSDGVHPNPTGAQTIARYIYWKYH